MSIVIDYDLEKYQRKDQQKLSVFFRQRVFQMEFNAQLYPLHVLAYYLEIAEFKKLIPNTNHYFLFIFKSTECLTLSKDHYKINRS